MVGEKNERKACIRFVLVTDADSGFAFQPVLGQPGDSTGQLLVQALLGAIRDGRCIPREIRVPHKEFTVLLSTLSKRLKCDVRVAKSLPALDQLKEHFLSMIGDPGEFSPL